MTESLIEPSSVWDNAAEGHAESYEGGDSQELHASAFAMMRRLMETHSMMAETGVTAVITLPTDDREQNESQDAPRRPEDETAPTPIPKLDAKPDSAAKAPLVLVIEDIEELAEVILATLGRMNVNAVHHSHGMRALEILDSAMPDVILLDIMLPDITGWRFLDEFKTRLEKLAPTAKAPKVIVITALDDAANRVIGKLQGVFHYMIKPVVPDELEAEVKRALLDRAS